MCPPASADAANQPFGPAEPATPAAPATPAGTGVPPGAAPHDNETFDPQSPDTETLALFAAQGDSASLDALLRAIRPDIVRRCGRFLLYREDAEEAAQDALLQVARNIHRFEGRSRFSTWLHTVVANCSRQKYRELKRRAAEQPTPPDEASAPERRPDPRTTSVIAGSKVDVLEALERLEQESPHLVAPLVYRDLCQMDYAEIVDRLGIPLGTVKSRLHHARRHIRPWLTSQEW
ncbi:RNA polymerase sigma factor [Streptomyces diacarni]|uniref:RNA polymerase sigma factor n=2 Tax=Streptomyces TaxID=1883 RepID=A0A367EGW5_9ACTN|nr:MULTISPECIES: RNA polymerase sigma factor [Streptomyces]RCG16875.1 RNA polymerase sigma factor [Streptomyces diacarni]UNS97759.1 RNA polymerase sigma factor [Streptomyces tubbatahanensis]